MSRVLAGDDDGGGEDGGEDRRGEVAAGFEA